MRLFRLLIIGYFFLALLGQGGFDYFATASMQHNHMAVAMDTNSHAGHGAHHQMTSEVSDVDTEDDTCCQQNCDCSSGHCSSVWLLAASLEPVFSQPNNGIDSLEMSVPIKISRSLYKPPLA